MPWNVVILCAVLLVVGAGLFAGVCLLMARIVLKPERMTGGRALAILRRMEPAEIGLRSEDAWFDVRDERTNERIRLAAWWIAAAGSSDRCVVILHGYSDSKIGGIAWAPTFRAMGYHVLALDLRAHGESGGAHSTAGYFERHDVSQAIDQLRAARPAETRELVIFGVSLGAAVAGAAAALRDDVAAVIMDCPYSDYVSAAGTHARAQGLPGPWFQRVVLRWATRMSGADFLECAPVRVIPTLGCPLMVISGAADLFVDPADVAAVGEATRRRPAGWLTVYWLAAETHHVLALRKDPAEFRARVGRFLDEARAWRAGAAAASGKVPQEISR